MVKSSAGIKAKKRKKAGVKTTKVIDGKYFKRVIGGNLVDTVSRLTITDISTAIVELIANSYDADAKEVNVVYSPAKNTMKIIDDGLGMSLEEVKAFYRLGDSIKESEPVSPGGRERIGEFGVATILLKSLCGNYRLRTRQKGLEISVEEEFEKDRLAANKKIAYETQKSGPRQRGTTIVMENLKFREGEDFDFKDLIKKIRWDLPLLPDFKVIVNGTPIKSKSIEKSTKFLFKCADEAMGDVSGHIYLTNQKTTNNGIYVYVNGRKIGDPKALLSEVGSGLRHCSPQNIIGVINANNLKSAILFDRGRFKQDHPGFKRLKKELGRKLGEVGYYSDKSKVENRVSNIESRVPGMLDRIKRTCIDSKIGSIGIEVTEDFEDDNIPGKCDGDTVYLNKNNPALNITSETNSHQYHAALLWSVISTLALKRAGKGGKASLKNYLKEEARLWNKLFGEKQAMKFKREIHPSVVYSQREVIRYSKFSLNAIDYLIAGEVLNPDSEGGIVGQEVLDIEESSLGMMSLHDFVLEHSGVAAQQGVERCTHIFGEAGEAAQPFIYDYREGDGEACYFVEQICAKDIFNALKSKFKKTTNFESLFKRFGSEYLTPADLAKKMTGAKTKDVMSIILYAGQKGVQIDRTGGKKPEYRYGDVIAALQHKRGIID